jgi:hypothetical protein
MFLTLEDETELGQVVVFNDVYLKYGRVLKDAVYLLVDGELQNDEEHGLAVVAHRISDLLHVIGRDAQGGRREPRGRAGSRPVGGTAGAGLGSGPGTGPPATAGPAAGGHSVPGGLTTRRPDAWELPAVEPRTRPGRTG